MCKSFFGGHKVEGTGNGIVVDYLMTLSLVLLALQSLTDFTFFQNFPPLFPVVRLSSKNSLRPCENSRRSLSVTLRCVIPVVCVTNEREESAVNQHN